MQSAVADPETQIARARERFEQLYGRQPQMFRAPGRVNLIGEHTDYNDGFVMPAAIEFYVCVAIAERGDRKLRAYSVQFDESAELSLDNLAGPPRKHWTDFVRGVASVLQTTGHRLTGADLVIDGEVPLGAGLSSSAALEMALALAFTSVSRADVPRVELVKSSQRAEHEFVGTKCGIMDQFISAFGKAGHALMLDCRSLEYQLLPIGADAKIVICNSMVKHELSGGEYNERRADCENAVRLLRESLTGIRALRDVTSEELEAHKDALPATTYRRARHVVSEIERVPKAADALKSDDHLRFGELMYESHASLRDDYEVSCKELDILVELASRIEGVFGARMTGGGFGGCTVNLVRSDAVERFRTEIIQGYLSATAITAPVYICSPADGAAAV